MSNPKNENIPKIINLFTLKRQDCKNKYQAQENRLMSEVKKGRERKKKL
jgi:hypothetical protein